MCETERMWEEVVSCFLSVTEQSFSEEEQVAEEEVIATDSSSDDSSDDGSADEFLTGLSHSLSSGNITIYL